MEPTVRQDLRTAEATPDVRYGGRLSIERGEVDGRPFELVGRFEAFSEGEDIVMLISPLGEDPRDRRWLSMRLPGCARAVAEAFRPVAATLAPLLVFI